MILNYLRFFRLAILQDNLRTKGLVPLFCIIKMVIIDDLNKECQIYVFSFCMIISVTGIKVTVLTWKRFPGSLSTVCKSN